MGCSGNRVYCERGLIMQMEKTIAKLMEDYHVAGMSVALIKNGQIVSVEGYGKRNKSIPTWFS